MSKNCDYVVMFDGEIDGRTADRRPAGGRRTPDVAVPQINIDSRNFLNDGKIHWRVLANKITHKK
jgi:cephalosporin hydroxylase